MWFIPQNTHCSTLILTDFLHTHTHTHTRTFTYSTSIGAEEIIDGILDHHYYDESMVYKLVGAASEKLGKCNITWSKLKMNYCATSSWHVICACIVFFTIM